MRVEVLSVGTRPPVTVTVDLPAGRFVETWSGSAPEVGALVDVEIDCPPHRWAEVVIGRTADQAHLGSLHGILEAVHSDGAAVLRSGTAISLIEMVGPQPDGVLDTEVTIPASGIQLFPINL